MGQLLLGKASSASQFSKACSELNKLWTYVSCHVLSVGLMRPHANVPKVTSLCLRCGTYDNYAERRGYIVQ